MPYKEKVKVLQQIEDYKRPSEKPEDCQKYFEQYCAENNLTTATQKAASAQNPMYYEYLLDYVGYVATTGKKESHEEVLRSTYIKAAGRLVMVKRVAEEYAKENFCQTRISTPPCNFMPAAMPHTTICNAEVVIEALMPGRTDWQVVFSGTGTAKRQGNGGYNDFYIEKAETAARARAIAAMGIGIDIQGGLSTIEDAQAAYEEERAQPEGDERMKMSVMEAEIRACLDAAKPMESINKVAKDMKDKAKELSPKAQAYLANVFEEVMAKISSAEKAAKQNG